MRNSLRRRSALHLVILTVGLMPVGGAWGQSAPTRSSRPIPYPVVPSGAFQAALDRGTRATTGTPGPRYWQQWADYDLRARLDPSEKSVTGSVRITYTNNSPDTLGVLYLHLDQNVHAAGAIRNRPAEVTGGVRIERVAADGRQLLVQREFQVGGTIMAVRAPQPLAPSRSIDLEIDWAFVVPQNGLGRMGWSRGNLFFIAYWYPRMAVYDDVRGWQLDPYLGNAEFYADFGNYDLTVEAPSQWLVMATGELRNRDEVFPAAVRQRLAVAERGDRVVNVVTQDDLDLQRVTQPGEGGWVTWRFHADSVRDVAFSVTSASLWDATRTPVGDLDGDATTDYARIDAIYRRSAPKWQQTARYAQHAIDFLSRFTGIPYPWPHMTAVEGADIIGGGMEFPMMTLIGGYNNRSDSALYYVTAHELGHMWVPMIVGVDERRYAWMDEGTTTFNENQARKEFFPGVNHDVPDRESYLAVARLGIEGEMMRWTDYQYTDNARSVASYAKPATLLAALRGLLGEERFRRAYHTYLAAWAYKHPMPWDFFNAFGTASGENLDWFWRTWYYETWLLDQAVADVTETADSVRVVIEDRGTAPMPARVAIVHQDGRIDHREIGVQTWLTGARRAEVSVPGGSRVVRVEIDPEGVFPDVDRTNNVWSAGEQGGRHEMDDPTSGSADAPTWPE